MARKTADITITAEGRDRGKVFRITEMDALRAEKWAYRVILIIGGGQLPENPLALGMAGLTMVTITGLLSARWSPEVEALLDEMIATVSFVAPENPLITRPLLAGEIEEVATLFTLRQEVVALHLGFSSAADLWASTGVAGTKLAA